MKVIELASISGKMGVEYKVMRILSFILKVCICCLVVNALPYNGYVRCEDKPPVYDLSMCIESALKDHPSVRQSQYMIKYYESGIKLAKSEFGPHLFFQSSIIQFETTKGFPTLLSVQGSALISNETSGTDYVAGLSLSQSIFTNGSFFGYSAPNTQREENNLTAQKFTDLKVQTGVVYDVIDAYGKVLKTLNSLSIEEASLKTSELLYATTLSKYKLDLVNKSELLKAESTLENHKARIEELKSTLQINLSTLSNKIGNGARILQISTDKDKFRSILCDGEAFPPLEKLFEMTYQKRNDIKAQEATINSLISNLKVIKSKRYPQLSLNANYFRRGELNFENNSYAWNAFVGIGMPIFDYGEISAEVSQQENLIQVQREVLRSLRNDVDSQVQESYQTVQSLKAKLSGLQKSTEQAKEALVLTEEKYKKELVAEADVLKANDELSQIKQSVYETEIDIIVNNVALRKAVGLDILKCGVF